METMYKKLKEEIIEADNYEQKVVELGQENENIEQVLIKNEDVIENYEMEREITSELKIKEESFDDDILQLGSFNNYAKKSTQGNGDYHYLSAQLTLRNEKSDRFNVKQDDVEKINKNLKEKISGRDNNEQNQVAELEQENVNIEQVLIKNENVVENYEMEEEITSEFQMKEQSDDDILQWESFNNHVEKSTQGNEDYLENIDKKLQEKIPGRENYEQNQVVELGQENRNIEQVFIKTENAVENHEMKKEITSELIIKDENFDERLQWKSESEKERKPFACSLCIKTFKRKDELTVHTRSHTGEKPYTCDVCKKTFKQKSHLTMHVRIHTGERPFACDVCKRTFITKNHLIVHKCVHTDEIDEILFACDVCKKTFRRKDVLIVHKRIHTGEKPYTCDVCKKTFTQKSYLTKHERLHTEEKLFECDVCKKMFITKNYLLVHKRIHLGEKPFSCDICKKTFGRKDKLNGHRRTHR